MNYLEIINKCLVELNYKQVNSFSELIKNEHKKLKNIINIINTEVCNSDKWQFLLRRTSFVLPKNTCEIENPIIGRIQTVIVDGKKLDYHSDYESFFINSQPQGTYSLYNDKILFSAFNADKIVEIFYYTHNCVKDKDGNEKFAMQESEDETLIPEVFAEPLLVYGSCMRLKGNPQHVRFSYWLSMYNNALANLRSKISNSVFEEPSVNMKRH